MNKIVARLPDVGQIREQLVSAEGIALLTFTSYETL